MYESHFGFRSAPFQLNPDPDFFFDSPGHGKALAHLRFGIQQGEGFIVVTGEVGAGKTTLVRALLQQLDPRELVAAHLSNTQLDADNLLQAILTAFAVPTAGQGKAGMLARLEAFLTSLAASGRRALLVIDEAQNLSTQALEELRMLSNFQLGHHGLLQSFLVGQPELRGLLQLPSMRQLQQRVLATYHLGPLSRDDTAAYVQHRLRHVGWTGQKPQIARQAFERLHAHSGGIPRRINLLCNRVLLATYLSDSFTVSAALVDEIAQELDGDLLAPSPAGAPSVLQPQPAPEAAPVSEAALASSPTSASVATMADPAPHATWSTPPAMAVHVTPVSAAVPRGTTAPVPDRSLRSAGAPAQAPRKYKLAPGAILAVAGDALAWGQLQALCRHWGQLPGGEPRMVMVHPGSGRADVPTSWREYDLGLSAVPCVYLECPAAPFGRRSAALAMRFAVLIDEVKPSAVLVAGSSHDLIHLATMAREQGIPLVRLAGGEAGAGSLDAAAWTSDVLNRSADLVCVPSVSLHQRLLAQGVAAWRLARVAPMTATLLKAVAPTWLSLDEACHQLNLSVDHLRGDGRRFALLTAQVSGTDLAASELASWLMVARHVGDDLPLVWLADPATADVLAQGELQALLRAAGVQVASWAGVRVRWSLLSHARLLISGPGQTLVDEAQVLGLPSVVLQLRGEPRAQWSGSGVTSVGPSRTHLLSAVRAALRSPRALQDPATLSDSGVSDMAAQLSHWIRHGDALPFQLHAHSAAA